VTEKEWLTRDSPQHLRGHLEARECASERKMRLFAVACCRRVDRWFVEACQHAAVDELERFADGLTTAEEVHRTELLTGQIDERHPALSDSGDDSGDNALDAAYHAALVVAQAVCNDPRGEDNPN
jgi:hypothetical protein